jgi:hypothetical protein
MFSNTLIKCKHCGSINCIIERIIIKDAEGLVTDVNLNNCTTSTDRLDEDCLFNIKIHILCDECNRSSILTLKSNSDDVSLEYLTYDEYERRKN